MSGDPVTVSDRRNCGRLPARAEVAVVGGGPAGAHGARLLAQAGLDVVLIEGAVWPRYKTCGGGIVGRTWRQLQGVELDDVIEHHCNTAAVTFAGGASFRTTRDHPIVSMTMRAQFDNALVEAASAQGVRVVTGCAVESVTRCAGRVEVATQAGAVTASCVVGADGALSAVARSTGFGDRRRLWPAIECELPVAAKVHDRFAGVARFDFQVDPPGYGWVFPKAKHLSAGILAARPGVRGLRRALARYLGSLGLDGASGESHGFVVPIGRRRPGRGRILLCGDAYGSADPVTAEGISMALWSGALAAQTILDQRPRLENVGTAYGQRAELSLGKELTAASRLAALLYGAPAVSQRLTGRTGQALAEAMTDVMAGHRTYRDLAGVAFKRLGQVLPGNPWLGERRSP